VALLCEAMVTLCKNNPERLGPWLADPRPSIVRAGVQVLGTIGGPGIVGPLQSLAKHPDARVRMEVLTALRGLKVSAARPVLLQYLESSDARLFSAALQKLSEARDPEVAQRMLLMMIEPDFEQRPTEEKHAIYSAIGLTGGDEVIPELEAELLKGGWFGRVNENHRQAVARCIARIGTAMARMVLEHAAQSKRGSVRDVCREMLERWGDQRG
jgi:HEAT repeat protein